MVKLELLLLSWWYTEAAETGASCAHWVGQSHCAAAVKDGQPRASETSLHALDKTAHAVDIEEVQAEFLLPKKAILGLALSLKYGPCCPRCLLPERPHMLQRLPVQQPALAPAPRC